MVCMQKHVPVSSYAFKWVSLGFYVVFFQLLVGWVVWVSGLVSWIRRVEGGGGERPEKIGREGTSLSL